MDDTRFREAVAAFDRENARDPQLERRAGVERPRELARAERLSAWVERLDPNASEALRLAARCQHIRRWEIPRSNFASGRVGYLKWRGELARFHADVAARILDGVGYDAATCERVRRINLKQGLHSNPDTQTMEDALCLAFLEDELEDFMGRYPEHKTLEILRKTWKKMSPRGHQQALELTLSVAARRLVDRALAQPARPASKLGAD